MNCRTILYGLALGAAVLVRGGGVHAATGDNVIATADARRISDVQVLTMGTGAAQSFPVFDIKNIGGGYLAAGDLDGDGTDEFVVGSGPGRENEVRVYEPDGTLATSWKPYAKGFRGGVRVAIVKNGVLQPEIITAPGPGVTTRVLAFAVDGKPLVGKGIIPYGNTFIAGAHVSAGDIDSDGKDEVVVTPGPGGGPHVMILDTALVSRGLDFFAYDQSMTDGVTSVVARTPAGPRLVVAPESWSAPLVRLYSFAPGATLTKEFYAFDQNDHQGVRLGVVDVDGDGFDEIVAAPNGAVGPGIRIFDSYGTLWKTAALAGAEYRNTYSFAAVTVAGKRTSLASLPLSPVVTGPVDAAKFIDVDITHQRLTAYEHGRVARSFFVSTGVVKHPTPLGLTTVRAKIPIMDYRWNYGPGNPDNYFLPNVKWNLNIFPHIYIHSAYWHRNFGHRMSHGCVNTSLADADWIYHWAEVGTPVRTHL